MPTSGTEPDRVRLSPIAPNGLQVLSAKIVLQRFCLGRLSDWSRRSIFILLFLCIFVFTGLCQETLKTAVGKVSEKTAGREKVRARRSETKEGQNTSEGESRSTDTRGRERERQQERTRGPGREGRERERDRPSHSQVPRDTLAQA